MLLLFLLCTMLNLTTRTFNTGADGYVHAFKAHAVINKSKFKTSNKQLKTNNAQRINFGGINPLTVAGHDRGPLE